MKYLQISIGDSVISPYLCSRKLDIMAENNSILDKLEGLVSRYEEVGTLITDPNVISDQKRYVKLTKEYLSLIHI